MTFVASTAAFAAKASMMPKAAVMMSFEMVMNMFRATTTMKFFSLTVMPNLMTTVLVLLTSTAIVEVMPTQGYPSSFSRSLYFISWSDQM